MFDNSDFDPNTTFFEWDDEKEQTNFRKHGIHFRTAAKVFWDPHKLIRVDEEHPEELRYDILGMVGKVLFVVCTIKVRENENVVRLISARIANAAEKARYLYGDDNEDE